MQVQRLSLCLILLHENFVVRLEVLLRAYEATSDRARVGWAVISDLVLRSYIIIFEFRNGEGIFFEKVLGSD